MYQVSNNPQQTSPWVLDSPLRLPPAFPLEVDMHMASLLFVHTSTSYRVQGAGCRFCDALSSLVPLVWSEEDHIPGTAVHLIKQQQQQQCRTLVCYYKSPNTAVDIVPRLTPRRDIYSGVYIYNIPQRFSGQAVDTRVVPSPRYVPSFLSRIGFSIPTARRFSSNVANSRSRAFRYSFFLCIKKSLRVYALGEN